MTISSLFGRGNRRYKFELGDGKCLSPSEFGRLAMTWSVAFGEQFMRDYFETGKPGWLLAGGSLVDADPLPAHLYVTSLYLASFLVYVDAVLHADQSVSIEVRAAIRDGFTRMQLPKGGRPDDRLLSHLEGVTENLFQIVVRDMKNDESADPETYRPQPLEATEAIYGLLKSAYAPDRPDYIFLGHEPDQVHHAMALQRALDTAPLLLMVTLKEKTQVRLVAE